MIKNNGKVLDTYSTRFLIISYPLVPVMTDETISGLYTSEKLHNCLQLPKNWTIVSHPENFNKGFSHLKC